ncbi:MAG: tetrahydromethanopterin S-methyltransferase subunit A [Thermoproteota archaeon]|nr:tetrahydromethanopterin S-methyltransferase subunit A [Thermoproteota archaeon]
MILAVKRLEDAAGKLCQALLPIKHEYYLGAGNAVAICTLSSIDLLETVSRSSLMNKVFIAGRLLSEKRDRCNDIFVIKHPALKHFLLCGKEVKGDRAGQALLALTISGMDSSGRIIRAVGPNPVLMSSPSDVEIFRHQVQIMNLIGVVDIARIARVLVP